MNTFLLSEDIRSSTGILIPRFATSTTQIINKKQWLKWMFDKLTDPDLLSSLPPSGSDVASDLLREAIIQLNTLTISGPNPNPLEVITNPKNYADDAEALAGTMILDILNGLIGHKTIRGIFMHTFTYYNTYKGFVLDSTTLRTASEMEKLFKLYEFVYPQYQMSPLSRVSQDSTPTGNSITYNIFHYLYGNADFRFTVVGTQKQFKFSLGYAPMTFLDSNSKMDQLLLSNIDVDLANKFTGYYEQRYDKKYDEKSLVQAFLDNSQDLFKIVEPKIRTVLKYLQYDERLVQDIMFKVIADLQAKSSRITTSGVRLQIDDLMRSSASGGIITFNKIRIGDTELKIYLNKQEDLAGQDIFTFKRDFSKVGRNSVAVTINEEIIEQINLEAIHNKVSVLWSILGEYYSDNPQQHARFRYIENKAIITGHSVTPFGWQFIGLKAEATSYDFIAASERKSTTSPSYIDISLEGLFNGDVNEMQKLLKVVRVSTSKRQTMGYPTQVGFTMSIADFGQGFTMEDQIAIFDGRMFYESSEVYSGPTYTGNKVTWIQIDSGAIDTSRLDIERINREWDISFLYGDLSTL